MEKTFTEGSISVIGVDFSGAAPDNNTWVAQGRLSGAGLELLDCQPMNRVGVATTLECSPPGTVASLDFPFSVPQDFASYWMPQARSMPELWKAAAGMDYPEFLALRDSFVEDHGESKRLCDQRFPECYSCLHKANPNMVPMTFRGMQMLDRLWASGCAVPPLAPQGPGKPVLLEAMPGAALKAMKLPYKGYKNGSRALGFRKEILAELPGRAGLVMPNLSRYEERCLFSHDCLDAVVAMVTAALWARQPDLFWRPEDPVSTIRSVFHRKRGRNSAWEELAGDGSATGLSAAVLEGWLYAPVFIARETSLPA